MNDYPYDAAAHQMELEARQQEEERYNWKTMTKERLQSNISTDPVTGCWLWRGHIDPNGYGKFHPTLTRSPFMVHKLAYELYVGSVPNGLELDHVCRNRACCNPAHLEPVTHKENMIRGALARPSKLYCKHGHWLAGDNIYFNPKGMRYCRECQRRRIREWKAAHK